MPTIQCYLPRDAFDALDLTAILIAATDAGIERPCIESSPAKIPSDQPADSVRVTCSIELALYLVDALAQQTERAQFQRNIDLLFASSKAVTTLFDAIEEARRP